MWPDGPFAEPRSSFVRPILSPTVAPDSSPTTTIELSCAWLPVIRGALQQLLLQSTWQPAAAPSLLQTQEWVFSLIDLFPECAAEDLPLACNYNFLESDGGWLAVDNTFNVHDSCIPYGTVYPSAEYHAGIGWKAFYDCTNSLLFIYKDITGLAITKVTVRGRCDEARTLHVTVNTTTDVISVTVFPGDFVVAISGTWSGVHMEVNLGESFDSDVEAYITSIDIEATGSGCP